MKKLLGIVVLEMYSTSHSTIYCIIFMGQRSHTMSRNNTTSRTMREYFEAEEKYVFTVLEENNELIQRALKEHRRLERLFKENENPKKSLSQLEEELDAHIRFEERILFNEIQKVATASQLEKISEIHAEKELQLEYHDPFWEN